MDEDLEEREIAVIDSVEKDMPPVSLRISKGNQTVLTHLSYDEAWTLFARLESYLK